MEHIPCLSMKIRKHHAVAAIFRKQWFFQMAPGAFNILAVRNSHTYTVAVISPAGPYNDQTVITGCVNRRPIGEIYIPVHMKLLFGKWHRLGPWGILAENSTAGSPV